MSVAAEQTPIERSRQLILEEIGDPSDLTLIYGPAGNQGDALIAEGTRALLSGLIYREIKLAEVCSARGHTALLMGGGAFCRPYCEYMPRALAVAGLRFQRVVVLPSSFDPSEDTVRTVLARTRATVFARERESYRRIRSLCDARLAHDCSFFFGFAPHRRRGRGTLQAFRTDREGLPGRRLPPGNDDISATAATLDEWLERIADHELVRTDRAHVMIAAALLGKRVEFTPSSYHKLEGIAAYALRDYPVRAVDVRRPAASRADGQTSIWPSHARVMAVILCREDPQRAMRAADSVEKNTVSAVTLIVDNNCAPDAAAQLAEGCARRRHVRLWRSDRNLGCASGRRVAVEETKSELVLFLDDDAELDPLALDLLVADLDAHPHALAVSATVRSADGTIQHSGGWMKVSNEVAEFGLIAADRPSEAVLPATGATDWVPGTAVLTRRTAFEEFPIDEGMNAYYEDNEWCYRVELARPGSFRRSREAGAVHERSNRYEATADFASRSAVVELLAAHARFYERHGKLLDAGLFDLVPELRDPAGEGDVAAARLLMELLLAKGTDWILMEWMNGNLDVLLSASRQLALQRLETAEYARTMAHFKRSHEKLVRVESGGWWRLRGRLLPMLRAFAWLRSLRTR